MRLNRCLIFAGMLFFGTVLLNAQEKPTVSVMPDKILYAPGETAKFDVTVVNGTKESVKGVLEVKVIWEMDETAIVGKENIELAPGDKKIISATWKTADVLGCEVRADLTDGTNLLATGAEYFNVCPAKDTQRVGIHTEQIWISLPGPERIISTLFHRSGRFAQGLCQYSGAL